MNWFTSIFSSEKKLNMPTNNAGKTTTAAAVDIPNVMEDLFVDNNAPTIGQEKEQSSGVNIQSFLERDHYGKGFQDGYN